MDKLAAGAAICGVAEGIAAFAVARGRDFEHAEVIFGNAAFHATGCWVSAKAYDRDDAGSRHRRLFCVGAASQLLAAPLISIVSRSEKHSDAKPHLVVRILG